MEKLIGRKAEKLALIKALDSDTSELIAITGRRRVGKTFLVRSALRKNIIYEFTGEHSGKMKTQLKNFTVAIQEYSKGQMGKTVPEDWTDAFEILKQHILSVRRKSKKVIFLDEFPWIDSKKSGFLSAFEHFWNSWCTRQKDLLINSSC